MKMMMYMMPLMIGFFALSYAATFTLYMVVNALMTLGINLASTGILYLAEKNRKDEPPARGGRQVLSGRTKGGDTRAKAKPGRK